MKRTLIITKRTTDQIMVTRTIDGFAFVCAAYIQDGVWEIRAWEIPYMGAPETGPGWTGEMKANHHLREATDEVTAWAVIQDMLDVVLAEAKSRGASNAGPYSDQQSKGPGS